MMTTLHTVRPRGLTVLYDARCPVCRRARRWVERQRHLVPIRFLAAGSAAARQRFPALDVAATLDDVTVVTDGGAVVRGEQAWIAVLWAVRRTRPLAIDLAAGRRRRALGGVKRATDAVRRLSIRQSAAVLPGPDGWPAPSVGAPRRGCAHCET